MYRFFISDVIELDSVAIIVESLYFYDHVIFMNELPCFAHRLSSQQTAQQESTQERIHLSSNHTLEPQISWRLDCKIKRKLINTPVLDSCTAKYRCLFGILQLGRLLYFSELRFPDHTISHCRLQKTEYYTAEISFTVIWSQTPQFWTFRSLWMKFFCCRNATAVTTWWNHIFIRGRLRLSTVVFSSIQSRSEYLHNCNRCLYRFRNVQVKPKDNQGFLCVRFERLFLAFLNFSTIRTFYFLN